MPRELDKATLKLAFLDRFIFAKFLFDVALYLSWPAITVMTGHPSIPSVHAFDKLFLFSLLAISFRSVVSGSETNADGFIPLR